MEITTYIDLCTLVEDEVGVHLRAFPHHPHSPDTKFDYFH